MEIENREENEKEIERKWSEIVSNENTKRVERERSEKIGIKVEK